MFHASNGIQVMLSKIINFFEAHVEKIVLAVVGVACVWLLLTRVILSPDKVEYGGENLSPGKIDVEINKEAEVLKRKLDEPPKAPEPYVRRLDGPIGLNDPVRVGIRGKLQNGFVGLFNSPLSDIDTNLFPPIPSRSTLEAGFAREYGFPLIGEVNDVVVGHIRAVAFVPAGTIDEKNAYKKEGSEPNDIDLVTVEGKFDVAGLYARFQECFAGKAVKKEEWYDPCLARPVFAAVQLQRQELNGDGTWSDWENVPRTMVDPYKKLFEVIEDVQKLPTGGLNVRMLQFDSTDVIINLLQPETYMIASANEEWFPPTLHNKYVEQQKQEGIEAKREALEKAKAEREKELKEKQDERRSTRTDTGTRTGRPSGGSGESGAGSLYGSLYGGSSRTSSRTATKRSSSDRGRSSSSTTDTRRASDRASSAAEKLRPSEGEVSTKASKDASKEDVYSELKAIMISPTTELAKMGKPLVFWACDDTVEPGKSYQYRIRLGVFNPIAGTNQFSEQDKTRKNNVILWSDFSDITKKIDIPGRSYFFANDIQEAAKTVTVEVCKYALGYWYSEKFPVKQGEVIGKVKPVESKPEEKKSGVTIPKTINYDTGAVFVDVIPVDDWSGGKKLVARNYYDMLYSSDGVNIEHMPVKTVNWSRELQATYSDLQKSLKLQKEPLRDWGSTKKGESRRRTTPGTESGTGFYEELMQRNAGGAGGRH
jgi:hypothetical protein